tara:strand:+ start:6303 stop:7646 length:1344 start_codon:yes stop_codon:yes gene_type:complete
MLGFSQEIFCARRKKIFENMEGSVMVLPAAPVSMKSRDTEFRYRADSELFYLTGVVDPGSLAVLNPNGDSGSFVLFIQPRDEEKERWDGKRLGLDEAKDIFCADEVYSLEDLEKYLPRLLSPAETIFFRLGSGSRIEQLVIQSLTTARIGRSRRILGPQSVADPGMVLDPMRIVKDPEEVERIRQAAVVTVQAYQEMLPAIRPGVGEWEIEAVLDSEFRKRGAWGPAYTTIVGSGSNSTILHYVSNNCTLENGDLVLVDAGAEVDLYNADITRTLPISGRFSDRQNDIYEIVLCANREAIETIRPGVSVDQIHLNSLDVLIQGLMELGILNGDKDKIIEDEIYKPFFPHQTSHWLGLDVHDVGDYTFGKKPRILEPGMVLTVEPGLYFIPSPVSSIEVKDEVLSEYIGIGVRIEDDVLVTSDGNEVLTASLPVTAEEIESLVGSIRD